ncbi:hypothetical protein COW36_19620 [bacterium (Candidatus Blackallbacteria) CG17_big_fil_post_rev_8_21_14_2_50_48_46]|uniref:SWIM-type domain-containing protein n=1 Tax=bacterium (Candidatus Blackallbacteria) CG17_big_fil_post_rev_8_21_14_2_50_48_46 TaxID=2014261 RepID=A0A2M7FZM3_9BACT|nr:MAG: hypothetical protein COW64_15675 [bacterium (Candidatus Blackallbacteria) CG18_big_fil_WC_8_21_14_2_50_49_26]PIW14862.1 MAG: hypothetical protein COW36_19620 [bacterium (Candidatus Blackallbacteria) CG17_big_fil_post_rev_8_21_14_2_50_48_46]PIW44429.1 MAG: hypothetical protein COW20_24195 [bacterium (Candidatus Blackallbacteria) CG13_big_fil_rev_8_21_14_2_50_49_14]
MSFYYYRSSGPKKSQGGIRLQSARGPVGTTWWGKRWVAALEMLCDQGRLSRGKSYARQGQVLSVEIKAGEVLAKVQGSSSKPYTVKIKLPLLKATQWAKIQNSLQASPLHLAKLLSGEMPTGLEEIFNQAGVSLFPEKRKDLQTDCSCPDWSDPCKHIAAVYYLLAEQFDNDPFLLFRLRGQEREKLLAALGSNQTEDSHPPASNEQTYALPSDPQAFWQGGEIPTLKKVQLTTQAPLLKRLKSPPLWRGQERFQEALEPIYENAAKQAFALLEELP